MNNMHGEKIGQKRQIREFRQNRQIKEFWQYRQVQEFNQVRISGKTGREISLDRTRRLGISGRKRRKRSLGRIGGNMQVRGSHKTVRLGIQEEQLG